VRRSSFRGASWSASGGTGDIVDIVSPFGIGISPLVQRERMRRA
jgi:hypothetical protein